MQEIVKMEKSLKSEINRATDYKCNSKAEFEAGGSLLKTFKLAEKEAKALKDKSLKPSLETTKQIREYFKPLEEKLEACIKQVKEQMDSWYTEQERIAAVAKYRILEDSRITRPETLERKLAETEVQVNGHTRNKREVAVTDLTKIPLIYFDLNEARLKHDLMEGIDVPGAKLVNRTIIVS